MITEQNKAIVRRFLEGLDNDLTATDESFTPTCVAYLPGSAEPTNREGLLRQYSRSLFAT